MAYKRITLKDPVTGDFLIPSTGGLEYTPTPEGVLPPFELETDAKTLDGHTADEFVKVGESVASANVATTAADSTPENATLKNIYAGTEDMVAGTTPLATGTLYLMYE